MICCAIYVVAPVNTANIVAKINNKLGNVYKELSTKPNQKSIPSTVRPYLMGVTMPNVKPVNAEGINTHNSAILWLVSSFIENTSIISTQVIIAIHSPTRLAFSLISINIFILTLPL